jgi:ribosomal protein S18 acetylase RimI-like enzyme
MSERPAVVISIETDSADELRTAVQSGLFAYNDRYAGPAHNGVLTIGARDRDRNIIGGLISNMQPGWKWMHVHWLWIDESHRRTGIGRSLLEAAEKEAQQRGCVHVSVDTFEFQARGFYEKQGYNVYGVQEDYPAGHRKFLLRKTF